MQNRMESNIRDKFLVKMIKLQEFTEKKRIAEMLNEMNPKLKALLAAGLIGTAGLGMQSCSNPSDSVYYPYTVETTTTGTETTNPGGGGTENGGNGGGTVEETVMEKLQRLCGELHVDEATIGNLANTEDTFDDAFSISKSKWHLSSLKEYTSEGFIEVDATTPTVKGKFFLVGDTGYFVPANNIPGFNTVITAYKAAYSIE